MSTEPALLTMPAVAVVATPRSPSRPLQRTESPPRRRLRAIADVHRQMEESPLAATAGQHQRGPADASGPARGGSSKRPCSQRSHPNGDGMSTSLRISWDQRRGGRSPPGPVGDGRAPPGSALRAATTRGSGASTRSARRGPLQRRHSVVAPAETTPATGRRLRGSSGHKGRRVEGSGEMGAHDGRRVEGDVQEDRRRGAGVREHQAQRLCRNPPWSGSPIQALVRRRVLPSPCWRGSGTPLR